MSRSQSHPLVSTSRHVRSALPENHLVSERARPSSGTALRARRATLILQFERFQLVRVLTLAAALLALLDISGNNGLPLGSLQAATMQPPVGGPSGGGGDEPPRPARRAGGPVVEVAEPPLPAGVVARIDGHDVSHAAYLEFLYRQYDLTRLSEFLDEQRLEQRALQLGVEVPQALVDGGVEEKIRQTVEGLYQGSLDAFEQSLRNRLQDLAGFRRWSSALVRSELLLERCILAERVVDDASVRSQFELIYGPGGTHCQVRHILLREDKPGDSAAARAARIMNQLADDPDSFQELARLQSDDVLTRASDGLLPSYQPGMFGDEFQAAVDSLQSPGQITGPIPSARGLHIVQLVGRTVTPLSEVADELRILLETRPATAAERTRYRVALRSGVRVEL